MRILKSSTKEKESKRERGKRERKKNLQECVLVMQHISHPLNSKHTKNHPKKLRKEEEIIIIIIHQKKEIINPFQKEKKKNCSKELNYDKVPVQTVRVKSNTHSVIVTTVDSSSLKTAYMVQFQLVLFLHFLLRLG